MLSVSCPTCSTVTEFHHTRILGLDSVIWSWNTEKKFHKIYLKTFHMKCESSKERKWTVWESHDPCLMTVSIEKSSTTPQFFLIQQNSHKPPRGARVRRAQRNPESQLSAETEDLRQHPDALEDHCIVRLQNRQQSERGTKPNESRQRWTQALFLRQAGRHNLWPKPAATSATQWQWFVFLLEEYQSPIEISLNKKSNEPSPDLGRSNHNNWGSLRLCRILSYWQNNLWKPGKSL